MSRWEPNARERLERASLELFVERGYDSTTVAEIAERAGLTKRTFFRHFADKREVLFSGQDTMTDLLVGGITGAPPSATPLDAVGAALDAVAPVFAQERLDLVRRRQALIAEHTDLQERELLKSATLATAMADGFRARGLPDPTAHVAAALGGLALRMSFERWVTATDDRTFTDAARETMAELRSAAMALT